MRRRAVPFALFVLAAAFLYAVQRDTFVRRWLVPPRDAAAAAKLNAVLPDVRLSGVTVGQALARLAEQAGVGIDASPNVVRLAGPPDRTLDLHLSGVTLAEALDAVLDREHPPFLKPVVSAAGGRVRVRTPAELGAGTREAPVLVRAYAVGPLLPPPGPPPPPVPPATQPGGGACFFGPPSPRRSDRDLAGERLTEFVADLAVGSWGGGLPARRFGDRVIVAAPAGYQEQVVEALDGLAQTGRPVGPWW